jgi:hypothetical protein
MVKDVQFMTTKGTPYATYDTQNLRRKKDDERLRFGISEAQRTPSTTINFHLEALPKDVLPAAVYKQQFLNLFICSHTPDHILNVSRPGRCIFWVPLLLKMRMLTKASGTSMLAICTAKLG